LNLAAMEEAQDHQDSISSKRKVREERKRAEKEDKAKRRIMCEERLAQNTQNDIKPPDNLPPWATFLEKYNGEEVLLPFENLKNKESEARNGRFIAEGPETLKLLLESDLVIVTKSMHETLWRKYRMKHAFDQTQEYNTCFAQRA
jgi:hypothetical protein